MNQFKFSFVSKVKIVAVVLLVIISFCFVIPPRLLTAEGTPTLPKAPYILAQEVRGWEREGKAFTFVDVREPEEYGEGHLEGAINIPYWQIEERAEEFRKDQAFVIYCIYSSWRAPYAANTLADLGLDNVYVLDGGVAAWNARGQVIYASNPDTEGKVAPYPQELIKVLKHPPNRQYADKVDLSIEELSYYDGKDGRPAYVAVNGVVYDVTQSRLWRGGEHDPSHGKVFAGRDLTEAMKESPHGDENLKKFPIVGRLVARDLTKAE